MAPRKPNSEKIKMGKRNVGHTQLQKAYGNDQAKSKSRDLVRRVIERNLLKFRKPSQLKVLCFPGIDATEIHEVYDPLGIPRENIVGVERDGAVAKELRKKDLGIKVISNSLEDYVISAERLNFDVVSLDYTGPLSKKQLNVLQEICSNQQRNHFVLHHANLVKRDRSSYALYFIGAGFQPPEQGVFFDTLPELEGVEEINKKLATGIHELSRGNAKEIRSGAYTTLLRTFFQGGTIVGTEEIFRFSCGESYEKILSQMNPVISSLVGRELTLNPDSPLKEIELQTGIRPDIIRFFEQVTIINLLKNLGRLCPPLATIEGAFVLAEILTDAGEDKKGFRIKDLEVYSYISESGAPMIGDIYFLSYPERSVDKAYDVARAIGYPNKFNYLNQGEFRRAWNDCARASGKFYQLDTLEKLGKKIYNRLFLGNSSRPVLTKQRAIDEFKEGASVDEIKAKYRGWTHKPLAQWKAHVTMGTYNSPVRVEQELIEHREDSNLEKITKEEAIDLISSGIPTKEIYETYPTSFSVGQLAAYKKHVTMGTYDKKEEQPAEN